MESGMTGADSTTSRDRETTEERILSAVGTILAGQGFAALNVKAVAVEAGVDKVLVYRYFGKIDDLLSAYGEHGEFWPSADEVLPPDRSETGPELLALFFERFISALRARPLTIEILAMEIAAPNPLTQALDRSREAWGMEIAQRLSGDDQQLFHELNGPVMLLVAGIQFLLIRARNTTLFSTFEIQKDECWQAISTQLAGISKRLLPVPSPPPP